MRYTWVGVRKSKRSLPRDDKHWDELDPRTPVPSEYEQTSRDPLMPQVSEYDGIHDIRECDTWMVTESTPLNSHCFTTIEVHPEIQNEYEGLDEGPSILDSSSWHASLR